MKQSVSNDNPTYPTMDMQTTVPSHPLNIMEENNGEKSMDPHASGEGNERLFRNTYGYRSSMMEPSDVLYCLNLCGLHSCGNNTSWPLNNVIRSGLSAFPIYISFQLFLGDSDSDSKESTSLHIYLQEVVMTGDNASFLIIHH